MDHAVIPAPAQFEARDRQGFAFRPDTTVGYADAAIAPLVRRFCAQVTWRTGLRLAPVHGDRAPDEPSVTINMAAAPEPGGLPAPAGLSPDGGDPAAERYSLLIEDGRVVLRAAEPAGVARGLITLLQLLASGTEEFRVPAARITDTPRYAWRGLSLDVARTFFTVGEIRRVIDLLELYKLNVLHLHLTDDQAWPLALGRPASGPEPGAPFYRDEDLRDLVGYAADRFVTIVPEIDTPGHTAALLRLRPDLRSGRNEVEYEFLPGHRRRAVWLDPELPATFELMEQVLAGVAGVFPGPYLHIGADEPRGMPDEVYASYVRRLRRLVRILGKCPLGWQESARAIWAETISGFDDLTFLLLPRLAGVAHRAWSLPEPIDRASGWVGHRDRLARHGRLWAQDGLTYFRASTVDWT